eukprot:4800056-Pleurochrysis_carterae.AAC.1
MRERTTAHLDVGREHRTSPAPPSPQYLPLSMQARLKKHQSSSVHHLRPGAREIAPPACACTAR